MTQSPFDDLAGLESGFASGLETMLEQHDGLGVQILALANAAYESGLWARLGDELRRRHALHARRLETALSTGKPVDEPADDLDVFRKLMAIGFDALGLPETRDAGPWRLTYNPLRALRPPRASGAMFGGLEKPFDPAGFHFDKPFLAKEILWQGELAGQGGRLLYNKFPFARFHGLWLPEPERHLPQFLTRVQHERAWATCAHAGVPGLCLAYNSLGAGASVNHLHFQSFVAEPALPLQSPEFVHNGGSRPYPLPVRRHADADSAWQAVETLHRRNQPYNLVYARDALYVVARRPQSDAELHDATRGWGWSEMAGALTLFERDAWQTLEAGDFASRLARFAPG